MAVKLLLVQGCPRSGTTLVNRLLNTHPEIAITNELDLVRLYGQLSSVLFAKHRKYSNNKINNYTNSYLGYKTHEKIRLIKTLHNNTINISKVNLKYTSF